VEEKQRHQDDARLDGIRFPRWPAALAVLAVGALYAVISDGLTLVLRVVRALVAGISSMPWRRFVVYNVLGGAVWATAAVSIGYLHSASISLVEHWVGRLSLLLVAALVLALLLRWGYRRATRVEGEGPDDERPS
jgi:membrane-associated protein